MDMAMMGLLIQQVNSGVRTNTRSPLCALLCTLLEFGCGQIMSIPFIRDAVYMVTDISFAISYSAKRTGIFKMMLDQAIQE